jgi:hypothetical protein
LREALALGVIRRLIARLRRWLYRDNQIAVANVPELEEHRKR